MNSLREIIKDEILEFAKQANSNNWNKKLYYHGRQLGNRPYTGNYIFITDNLGYASGYSDGKELYTYTIPFDENKLFSIRNPKHRQLLSGAGVSSEAIQAIIRDSGPNQEIDWAALSYIGTDEFDMPEDLLMNLGFLGVRLKERQGIESIYIFDQKNLKFMGTIDISTPEMIQQISKFYRDFTKDKNFLEESFTDLPQELFDRLKLRKFSDEANRSHMKLFKAKDGKNYIISKGINQDVFKASTLDGKQVGVAVFDDDKPDYFTGYETSQSIKVEPEYQRLGIATAMTDFAESIYHKPYRPTKVLSEPMQGFVKNRFSK